MVKVTLRIGKSLLLYRFNFDGFSDGTVIISNAASVANFRVLVFFEKDAVWHTFERKGITHGAATTSHKPLFATMLEDTILKMLVIKSGRTRSLAM